MEERGYSSAILNSALQSVALICSTETVATTCLIQDVKPSFIGLQIISEKEPARSFSPPTVQA